MPLSGVTGPTSLNILNRAQAARPGLSHGQALHGAAGQSASGSKNTQMLKQLRTALLAQQPGATDKPSADGLRQSASYSFAYKTVPVFATQALTETRDLFEDRDVVAQRDVLATRDTFAMRDIVQQQAVYATRDVYSTRNVYETRAVYTDQAVYDTTLTGTRNLSTFSSISAAGIDIGADLSVKVGTGAAATVKFTQSNKISVTANGTTQDFTFTANDGSFRQALTTALNSISGLSASYTTDGKLKLRTSNAQSLHIADVANGLLDFSRSPLSALGLAAGTTNAVLTGYNRVQTGTETVLTGQEQYVSGQETYVSGYQNVVTGQEQYVSGQETYVAGTETYVAGTERVKTGTETVVTGQKSIQTGERSTLVGLSRDEAAPEPEAAKEEVDWSALVRAALANQPNILEPLNSLSGDHHLTLSTAAMLAEVDLPKNLAASERGRRIDVMLANLEHIASTQDAAAQGGLLHIHQRNQQAAEAQTKDNDLARMAPGARYSNKL